MSERQTNRVSSSTAILFHYEGNGASKKGAEERAKKERRKVFVEGERISGGQGTQATTVGFAQIYISGKKVEVQVALTHKRDYE